jgi:hypothetical protein
MNKDIKMSTHQSHIIIHKLHYFASLFYHNFFLRQVTQETCLFLCLNKDNFISKLKISSETKKNKQ